MKKEASVNFLTDPQEGSLTLRPTNVLVYGWEAWKRACVEFNGVSCNTPFSQHKNFLKIIRVFTT